MPKQNLKESVLHDWVTGLTFQQQALLLTGMRGPDAMPKHNAAKAIVRYLRGAVIKPAGTWSGFNDNDFMWGDYDYFIVYAKSLLEDPDAYPFHFMMHLIHCAEVVGYKHPDKIIRDHWFTFYTAACDSFHMTPETEKQMDDRLSDFGCGIHNLNVGNGTEFAG